jgi:hypothetical protein
MNTEEKIAVTRCRIIAGQTIADINAACREELIAGWAAVWQMHQAVMVPLVSLFSHISSPVVDHSPERSAENDVFSGAKDADVEVWKMQIETAIHFFDKMRSYSIAAKKSKDVVERLYEASKHVLRHHEQHTKPNTFVQGMVSDASQAFETFAYSDDTLQAYSTDRGQLGTYEESLWGPSPYRDAAMDSFWDDMLWGTLPETGGWMQGFNQFDWTAPSE